MKQKISTSYDIETGQRAAYTPDIGEEAKPARSQTKETKLKLVQFLNVGRLKKTYYLSEPEVNYETVEIITKFAFGTDKDVEFLAKAIVHAREVGHMRTVPILALAILSSSSNDQAKIAFRKIFKRIVKTGSDVKDFMEIIESGTFRGFGKTIQKAVTEWLQQMTPYEAIKYGSRTRKRDTSGQEDRVDELNLGDIIKLCHPTPTDERQKAMFAWLMGKSCDADQLPSQIAAYETFKATSDEGTVRARLVAENELPFEIVSPLSKNVEVWKQLCLHAPFMNLIKNLKNFNDRGLFKDEEVLEHVCSVIGDPEVIKRSQVFPFRFVSAFDEMIDGPAEISEALEDAIEAAYESLPDVKGVTAIIVDQSGSMAHSKVSDKSDVSIQTIANTFAAILYKKSKKAYLVPFATKAEIPLVSRRQTTLDIADSLVKMNVGNETNLSAPIKKLITENIKVDTIIAITDNNSWLQGLREGNAGDVLSEYLNSINQDVQMFFINTELAGKVTPVNHQLSNACFLYGWSDNLIKYILENIQKKKDYLEDIDTIEI